MKGEEQRPRPGSTALPLPARISGIVQHIADFRQRKARHILPAPFADGMPFIPNPH